MTSVSQKVHFQGDKVTERKPTRLLYHTEHPVADPGSRNIEVTIVKGVHHDVKELPRFVERSVRTNAS